MRALVACEFSGVVRDALAAVGVDAWSCDLAPCERGGKHLQCDVRDVLGDGWDMMIAHPPCTHLAVSGARWWRGREREQADAVALVVELWTAPIARVCIENPVGCLSTRWKRPTQIVQPWQFGHGETKATCLWLRGLPDLEPTNVVAGRESRIHKMAPGPNRGRERSRTYPGIAWAMADQWGGLPPLLTGVKWGDEE